jgi:phosphoribosylamine--glycine ligase
MSSSELLKSVEDAPNSVKVLVIGTGGRESALCTALARDPHVTALACAPGNPGTAPIAEQFGVDVTDPEAIADLAERWDADLTVVGPEVPLVAGAVDSLHERGRAAFGPTGAAAQLEGSKSFAKAVMIAAGVPTARGRDHHLVPSALADLDDFGPPYVVKYDGLAAGKGVTVTLDHDIAGQAVRAALQGPDDRVVIEEFLDGPEVSLFCVVSAGEPGDTDGSTQRVVPLTPAQDFKRALDGDEGPNTGGMGAYSPLPWAPPDLAAAVVRDIALPTVAEMARRGTPFSGLLYIGLALTADGPKVIEFNVRFGDPETQAVLSRLTSPLTELLRGEAPTWSDTSAVTVVVAAPGYPDAPVLGGEISGLELAAAVPGASVAHAGTRLTDEGRLVASGGRVLAVTGVGADLTAARDCAYEAARMIHIVGGEHLRFDIAQRAAEAARIQPLKE